nr:MAG TPA_asm: hypothetical protein [Caudoviricetes sp.]
MEFFIIRISNFITVCFTRIFLYFLILVNLYL